MLIPLTRYDGETIYVAAQHIKAVLPADGHDKGSERHRARVITTGTDLEWDVRETPVEVVKRVAAFEAVPPIAPLSNAPAGPHWLEPDDPLCKDMSLSQPVEVCYQHHHPPPERMPLGDAIEWSFSNAMAVRRLKKSIAKWRPL